MASQIVQLLDSNLPITITEANFKLIRSFCLGFETRDKHPFALNTAYLGIHKIQFTQVDRNTLFNIYYGSGSESTIKSLTKLTTTSKFRSFTRNSEMSEMAVLFRQVDEIDETRKTQSDVFNIFSVYLLYKVHNSSLPKNIKIDYIRYLLKILQYRFFTSLVGQRFKYGANEDVMRSTVNGLSNKFAIIQHGTWKKLIEARADEFYNNNSPHYKTITTGHDDKAILYLITDLQTRLRNQINIITSKYYTDKDNADTIKSYSLSGTDLDGEKVLLDQKNVYETMTIGLTKELYVLNDLIDNELVSLVCKLYSNITPDTFKLVLRKLSIKIVEQSKSKTPDKGIDEIKQSGDLKIYIGMRVYIRYLIQDTYRFCIQSKVPINNKLAILKAIKDAYGSSRIADNSILSIKESTAIIVDSCGVSRRAATLTSLKLAVITYFMIKSFRYL